MLNFSEQLNEYMKNYSISTVDLAKETGFDRTAIYRYVKGTRIPSDIEVVKKIADALQMPAREKKELIEAYDKLVWGEENVYSWQYIQELMETFYEIEKKESSFQNYWRMSRELQINTDILSLDSKEEIVTCILNFMSYVAEKESCPRIYMVMQPVYEEVQKHILPIFRNSKVKLEQIICMEQRHEKGYENLKIFQKILPVCFGLESSEAFYYYDSLNNHLNEMSGFVNFIIIQDCVIQFDYNMKKGVLIRNPVYYETMCQQYQFMRRQSKRYMSRGSIVEGVGGFANGMDGCNGGSLFSQLCMGYCISGKMYEEHLYPMQNRSDFIEAMIRTHGDWIGKRYISGAGLEQKIVSYGSAKGMEEFMDTGCICEFPSGFYRPFSLKERRLILDRMILLAEAGRIRYHILPEEMKVCSSIQIYWIDKTSSICLNRIREDEVQSMVIEEPSIYRTFRNCMEYLEKKEMILGEEESVKWLKELRKNGE